MRVLATVATALLLPLIPLASAQATTVGDPTGDVNLTASVAFFQTPLSLCTDTARDITSVTADEDATTFTLALHVVDAHGGLTCQGVGLPVTTQDESFTRLELVQDSPAPGHVYVMQVGIQRVGTSAPSACFYVSWNDASSFPAEWCESGTMDANAPAWTFPLHGMLTTLNGASHGYDVRGDTFLLSGFSEATSHLAAPQLGSSVTFDAFDGTNDAGLFTP